MTKEEVRNFFPHIAEGITYLNHAATGPFSKPLRDEMKEYFRVRSEENIDDYPGFVRVTEETKNMLAMHLNTESSRIAFLDNTTNGLNLLAQGFHWGKGDEIILNDLEFPANIYPFMNLEKKGVKIVIVKSHEGLVSAEDIIEKFTTNTRMVSVSMVQFLSGYRIDLNKLGNECKRRGIILSVDAIQGLGAFPLNVRECNIDFVSCGTQKWMLGLQGLAFIYVSPELQQILNPVYVGWLGVNDGWNLLDYKLSLKESAERFQPGSLNSAGIYALNASLKIFRDYGIEKAAESVLANTNFLIGELKQIGIEPLLPISDDKYLSGIISFRHKNAYSIVEILKERRIEAAVREGIVRISPHFYNNNEDLETLIKSLKLII